MIAAIENAEALVESWGALLAAPWATKWGEGGPDRGEAVPRDELLPGLWGPWSAAMMKMLCRIQNIA